MHATDWCVIKKGRLRDVIFDFCICFVFMFFTTWLFIKDSLLKNKLENDLILEDLAIQSVYLVLIIKA